jgi:hypothetical protein
MASLSDLEKFKETINDRSPYQKKQMKHPKGFEPSGYFNEATKSGEIVSSPQKSNEVDWKEQLESYFGKDASKYSVVEGTAEIRFWDVNVGNMEIERLYYFKAKIVSSGTRMRDDDFNELLNKTKKIKKPPVKKLKKGKTFCVALSDWQIGKEGSDSTVDRWMAAIPKIKDQIKTLRRSEPINDLLIAGLGDIVEGCGHYAMQEFQLELDFRQQQKVARRMAYQGIKELAPLFDKTLVAFIGGNHGETRKDGKAFTTFGDNKDVMLAEELQEIFKEAPAFKDKVKFIIPENDLHLTFDCSDTVLTIIHGHQARRGGTNAQAKARTWLADQSLARSEIADSDVLLMGHYHFFSAYSADGNRLICQAPSLDSGSQWFDNVSGGRNGSGVLTLVLGGDEKWSNIRVIR